MPCDGSARTLTYAEALCEGLTQAMQADPSVFVIGEGVPDPKAIFGTTRGLRERFGAERVFDMPVAEGGLTGVCIGAALAGMRPVMVHQRMDFALLAFDQLVNNAAKWHYMFGGAQPVPLVVRMLIGRGWGQGPQHSQALHALLAHVPGLKVAMPACARDAKGMLLAAVRDSNPVVLVEHRWLYELRDQVDVEPRARPLDGARVVRPGRDATVAALSYSVVEALAAAKVLAEEGVDLEVIDLRCASPLDAGTVVDSVARTGRLAVLDPGWRSGGIPAELIARVAEAGPGLLRRAPLRIALPDAYPASSPALAADYYPTPDRIALQLLELVGRGETERRARTRKRAALRTPLDVPHRAFTGPF